MSNEAADALRTAANIRRLMLAVDIARAGQQRDGALADVVAEIEMLRSGIPEDGEDFKTRVILERHMRTPGTSVVPGNTSDAGLAALGITKGKPED